MSINDISILENRKSSRKNLQAVERNVLIAKLVDALSEGWVSSAKIAKQLHVSRDTIERYRPLADELIGKIKIEHNVIRNLQLKRTYNIIERLMGELDQLSEPSRVKERTLIYNQIYKFSSHLAQITGINVETHVNIDHQKLVIVRANSNKKPKNKVIEVDVSDNSGHDT